MIAHTLHIDTPFFCEAGGVLTCLDVVYHTSAFDYTPDKKVVWIFHALTANSDVEDWWPEMVGPGRCIDTEQFFVVCVNMLGTPYGSTGPASVNPQTGKPWLLHFPRITVRDLARVNTMVREHLGIETIDLMVGSSIGGFQAVEWAVMEGSRIRHAVFIATAARMNAWCSATLSAQRMALEADGSFWEAKSAAGGRMGLECARAIGLLTYRTFDCYVLTQSENDVDTLFPTRADSYERYQGRKLSQRYDAYSYLCVINCADSHNVGRGRDGVEAALRQIKADTTVVAVDSDGLFPPKEMSAWAQFIPGSHYVEIPSRFGHDGFLLENERLTAVLRPLLRFT